MKTPIKTYFFLAFTSLALIGCGGGGGSGGSGGSGGGSNSSSSSSSVVAKIDQEPLQFSEASVNVFIDEVPSSNPLTGGSGKGAVSFVSDNADVAIVDQASGEVSIVGAGSATIAATKSADDIYNATTATYTLTISKYNQDPLIFEQSITQAFMNAPATINPVSGGSGNGAISYEIDDSTIASIDADSGAVTALKPGVTSVIATKAADGLHNSTTTSYSLSVVELLSGLEILVGATGTQIAWEGQVGPIDLARTTNPNCDIDKIHLCANRQLTTISSPVQTPVLDTYIKTTTPAYLIFQNETFRSDPINVSVPLAPFPKRSGGQLVSFKGKLWMFGGMDDQSGTSVNDITWYNDIWSSEDGISWKLEISNAAFPPRSRHQVLEYRGDLYLFGGREPLGTEGQTWDRSTVWKSSDGVLWQQMSDWAFDGAHSAKFIVFDDKIWGIGGSAWADLTGIWSTTDGTEWNLENANAPFGPREGHALYTVNNLLMVHGGYGSQYNEIMNDVWSSPDGVTWKEETKSTSFAPRVEVKVQSLNGFLWLMGGNTGFTPHKTGYASLDGISWTLATTQLPLVGQYDAVALHNNALWIYGGFEDGLIWKSNNGTVWGVPVDSSATWQLRP